MAMNFEDFKNEICRRVKENYGEEHVRTENIKKNNGTSREALIIQEDGTNIFPTLYLDDYYKQYQENENLDDAYDALMTAYKNHRITENMDISIFSDWNKIKDKITYRVINSEKNQELLNDVPNRPCLDLSVVYYINLESTEDCCASSLIHNSHMDTWSVTENELWEAARSNKIFEVSFRSLFDFLNDSMGSAPDIDTEPNPLRIVTTNVRSNGAYIPFLDEDFKTHVLKEFSGEYPGAFILPSSIHETMLLFDDGKANADDLKALVKEVNETQVAEAEILSDSVYYMDFSSAEISIAA